MSKEEINNTVQRLWDLHRSFDGYPTSDHVLAMRKNVADVVNQDQRFESFSRNNILRVFILNRKYAAIPKNWFGVHILDESL